MTKFAEARAAHNATKAKWQRARELAAQHLEERKQKELERQMSRRSSKESVPKPEDIVEMARQRTASKEVPPSLIGVESSGMKEFTPRPRVQSKESTAAPSSRFGSKELPARRFSQASSNLEGPLLEEHAEDPRRYLWRFGYFRGPEQPELQVDVTGHSEYQSNSWLPGQDKEEYSLSCKLSWESPAESRVLEWKTKLKLTSMRSRLHDNIKKGMGAEYNEHFQDTRFAHHGGIPGTTTRLRKWFQTLTELANRGQLKTQLLALLLRELEVPIPEKSDMELNQLQHMLAPPAARGVEEVKSKTPSPVHHAREPDIPSEPEVPLEPYTNNHGPFVTHAQHLVVAL